MHPIRLRVFALVIAGFVMTGLLAFPLFVAADVGTPPPAHESPKTPHGAEGTTAVIGIMCGAIVMGALSGGAPMPDLLTWRVVVLALIF